MLTLATIVALNRPEEFKMRLRAAENVQSDAGAE